MRAPAPLAALPLGNDLRRSLRFGVATSDAINFGSPAYLDDLTEFSVGIVMFVRTHTSLRQFLSKGLDATDGWALSLAASPNSRFLAQYSMTDLDYRWGGTPLSRWCFSVYAMNLTGANDTRAILYRALWGAEMLTIAQVQSTEPVGSYTSDASRTLVLGNDAEGSQAEAVPADIAYVGLTTGQLVLKDAIAWYHALLRGGPPAPTEVPGLMWEVSPGSNPSGMLLDLTGRGNHAVSVSGVTVKVGVPFTLRGQRRLPGWQVPSAGAQTITPSPVVMKFVVPAPTVVAGAITLTPSPVVAKFVVPAPVVAAGTVTLTPAPVVAKFLVPAPTVTPGAVTLTPSPVVARFLVPAPTLVPGAVVLTPAAVMARFVIPTPTVFQGNSLAPSPVVARFVMPAPAVLAGGVTVTPSAVVAKFLVPAPVVVRGAVTLTPSPVVARFVVPAPVVLATYTAAVSPVVARYLVPAPTITQAQTLTPAPVVARWIVPAPTLVITGVQFDVVSRNTYTVPIRSTNYAGAPQGVIFLVPALETEA